VSPTSASAELTQLITDIGTVTGSLTNSSIGSGGASNPPGLTFYPNISYTGTGVIYGSVNLTFDGENNLNSQFFITSDNAFTFTSTTFNLINGARACNIFWLASTPSTGAFTATNSSVPGIIITGAGFTVTNNAAPNMSITGHIFSQGAATFTRSGAGELNINTSTCPNDPNPIVCYLKGTLILTKRGFVPIESIKAGHKVVTKGKIYNNKFIRTEANPQIEPVMWVSKFKVTNLNSKSRPICIKKDALGQNYPFQDLYVSPGHSLLLNGKMVLAKNIVNGTTIYQDKECKNVEYYHLECDNHSAIFANGVLSESYLDVNNRDVFENSIRLQHKYDFRKIAYLK